MPIVCGKKVGEDGVREPGYAEDRPLGVGSHEGDRHAFVGVGAAVAELVASEVIDRAKVGLALEELLGVLGSVGNVGVTASLL